MNEKNKGKRASATIVRPAHHRLKQLATKRGFKLNFLIDVAIYRFLQDPYVNPETIVQLEQK